jgi:electron transfer flavoprotein beta subunit
LKILVCVKRVPDTAARIRVGPDGRGIDPDGIKWAMGPYDEFALEAGLRIRDELGSGEVAAISLGGPEAGETLRTALAMGADRATLLRGTSGWDGLATARRLAAGIRDEAPDLVLLGVRAVDDDQQQVGPMLATLLGRPCATSVRSFRVAEGHVVAEREVEGGVERVRLPLPGVLTITKGPHEPRLPTLRGIMDAKRKPLEERDAAPAEERLELVGLELPPPRPEGRIVGEGPQAVPELVRLLREEAKVL